jgi:hypothetical protein
LVLRLCWFYVLNGVVIIIYGCNLICHGISSQNTVNAKAGREVQAGSQQLHATNNKTKAGLKLPLSVKSKIIQKQNKFIYLRHMYSRTHTRVRAYTYIK